MIAQVHKTEGTALKAKRAKNWAEESYLKLSPGTRAAIKGSIAVVRVTAKAATGI